MEDVRGDVVGAVAQPLVLLALVGLVALRAGEQQQHGHDRPRHPRQRLRLQPEHVDGPAAGDYAPALQVLVQHVGVGLEGHPAARAALARAFAHLEWPRYTGRRPAILHRCVFFFGSFLVVFGFVLYRKALGEFDFLFVADVEFLNSFFPGRFFYLK